jgi:mono/diheme cytochrome c family protein
MAVVLAKGAMVAGLLAGVGVAFSILSSASFADAAEKKELVFESTALGAYQYRTFCASCHGPGGRGDGSLAAMLKVRPSDLTAISQRNGGVFPKDRLAAFIDGREEVKGHGDRDMPVWGDWFSRDVVQQQIFGEALVDIAVDVRIDTLLVHLESLQGK